MKNGKYFIVIFCNKKRVKILHRSMKKSTIYDYWHEFKTQKPPRYLKLQSGKRNRSNVYELALIFPNNRWAKTTYTKDDLGRTIEVEMEDKKRRIKELVPYWAEELIYDFDTKKRIRYHEIMEIIFPITEISQIFTLNNKIVLQVEDNVRMFGNKNTLDAERLFELIKEDLINKNRGNFIFVKDVSTHQRKMLYDMLENKGYKRTELVRHYSY